MVPPFGSFRIRPRVCLAAPGAVLRSMASKMPVKRFLCFHRMFPCFVGKNRFSGFLGGFYCVFAVSVVYKYCNPVCFDNFTTEYRKTKKRLFVWFVRIVRFFAVYGLSSSAVYAVLIWEKASVRASSSIA